MIRTVWLSPDVVKSVTSLEATINVCRNSVTEYMVKTSHRDGDLFDDLQRFDNNVCAVALEAIASTNPHLRDLLGASVKRSSRSVYGNVEVRFSDDLQCLLTNNPGTVYTH